MDIDKQNYLHSNKGIVIMQTKIGKRIRQMSRNKVQTDRREHRNYRRFTHKISTRQA